MIPPTGRLKSKKREFHEVVFDMRHAVCSVMRERQLQGGPGIKAMGTGFFVAQQVFITCDHVMNHRDDPHQNGDSYLLVTNLTGTSGQVYRLPAPTIGNEVNLFPSLDLAILRVANAPATQPYVCLDYGDVFEGEEIGVVGYPLPKLNTDATGNIAFNDVVYRAARGHVTGRYVTNDGALINVPYVEVNFLFVPGNSGGPVFNADNGRVIGFVRGFRAMKIKETVADVTMIRQLPLGMGNQYIQSLNAIYSLAVKLDYVRATLEGFGVTL